jgi:hypothetical protein
VGVLGVGLSPYFFWAHFEAWPVQRTESPIFGIR